MQSAISVKVKQFLFENVQRMESKTERCLLCVLIVTTMVNYLKGGCSLGMLSPDTHLLLFLTVEVLPGSTAASLFYDTFSIL